jgi:hypothetical protein
MAFLLACLRPVVDSPAEQGCASAPSRCSRPPRPLHVAEEDRHLAARAPDVGQLRPVDIAALREQHVTRHDPLAAFYLLRRLYGPATPVSCSAYLSRANRPEKRPEIPRDWVIFPVGVRCGLSCGRAGKCVRAISRFFKFSSADNRRAGLRATAFYWAFVVTRDEGDAGDLVCGSNP